MCAVFKFKHGVNSVNDELPLPSISERLRDEQRTASRRFCRLDIKSIGTGMFKVSEAVFIRMIWSAKTGGSDGGGSLSKVAMSGPTILV